MSIFFSGIGGSGMSALAILAAARGNQVAGSDRSRDQSLHPELFKALEARGIRLFPQDGTGISPDVERLIVSTAIEETNPDVRAAQKLGTPIIHRAEFLAEIFHSGNGIAVGGTSGKSTVTGMIGWIATCAGLDPTIVNGGRMKNFLPAMFPANARPGSPDWIVIEADESDGSIRKYHPTIAVVTNISKDHKPIDELVPLFQAFLDATMSGLSTSRGVVLNADCPISRALRPSGRCLRFGLDTAADLHPESIFLGEMTTRFRMDGVEYAIPVPGKHNVMNALAAIAVARLAGIDDAVSRAALSEFAGIGRRFDPVGSAGGVDVIDDFAHNPDKIRATLAMSAWGRPRLIVFQPHGYGPTRFLLHDLIDAFAEAMTADDILFLPEIYYAGGTATKDVSSADIARGVAAAGRQARFLPTRPEILDAIAAHARPGDLVIVMGARDDSLTDFCGEILRRIQG
jgi:UDP-N-acetylmuramate--alanine ligase